VRKKDFNGQRTEAWDEYRKQRATSSNFKKIITAKRLDLSATASKYASEIAAAKLMVGEDDVDNSFVGNDHTDRGNAREPDAIADYEYRNDLEVEQVDFVIPDYTDEFGASPDALVGEDGLLEVKCPVAAIQIARLRTPNVVPSEYTAQIQGQLFVTGRKWCDFLSYHPETQPLQIRVYPDAEFQAALAEHMVTFLKMVKEFTELVEVKKIKEVIYAG